jgi:DNA-binding NarL/FixJ family response regulator
MKRTTISIHADDPVVRAGVLALLYHRPEVQVVDGPDQPSGIVVLVLCADVVDEPALAAMRRWGRSGQVRTVLVVGRMHEARLLDAIECGVVAVVRRQEATPEALVHAIQAAERGAGDLPADLQGDLLNRVSRARRSGSRPETVALPGFSDRESDVVKLIAEGFDTREIASKLNFSERTVKNVLQNLMLRLQLRNRAHAVAYAARQGYL